MKNNKTKTANILYKIKDLYLKHLTFLDKYPELIILIIEKEF